ncbi:MAG: hypothetical protein MUE40_10130 [Anaerolineae bacterium]|jgi:hypothetical protein|nr:hypothetical protein [Anaerolineae bacterium]
MIEIDRVETGILVYRWIDTVNMAEAQGLMPQTLALTGGQPYVVIIDMTQLRTIPIDFMGMRAAIRQEVCHGLRGYVLLNSPRTAEAFIKPVSALAPTTYLFAHAWEEAVQQARALLRG